MISVIKDKINELDNIKDDNKRRNKTLEIYSIILGYYAARRDIGPYIVPDRFDEVLNKIQELCNIKQTDLEFRDCTLDTILKYSNNLITNKELDTETCTRFLNSLLEGYDYYQVKDSNKFINNLTNKKHKKIQKKLNEFI